MLTNLIRCHIQYNNVLFVPFSIKNLEKYFARLVTSESWSVVTPTQSRAELGSGYWVLGTPVSGIMVSLVSSTRCAPLSQGQLSQPTLLHISKYNSSLVSSKHLSSAHHQISSYVSGVGLSHHQASTHYFAAAQIMLNVACTDVGLPQNHFNI